MYSEDSCTQPISISFHVPAYCPTIEAFFKNYVRAWCTPDGYEYGDALSAYRNAGDAGCGFWGLWNPRAPEYWLNARREAMAVVKDAIDGSRKGHSPLDTEGAVFKAMPDDPAIVEWHKVRGDFIPNPEATWFTASLIYEVQALINQWEALGEKVIVWSFDTPVAQALTSITGCRTTGQKAPAHGGPSKTDDSIEDDAKMRLPTATRRRRGALRARRSSAARQANRYGRNLQYYAVNIWVGWNDASTIDIEQGLGRTHRQGQTRPVHNQIVITCGEALDAFAKAVWRVQYRLETATTQAKVVAGRDQI
jgi:hypothetical protein